MSAAPEVPRAQLEAFLAEMLLIRRVEEKVEDALEYVYAEPEPTRAAP